MLLSVELLVKVVGRDKDAVQGFADFLKETMEHAYPGPIRQNDRDEGWHIFVNVTLEGSEGVRIMRRSRT